MDSEDSAPTSMAPSAVASEIAELRDSVRLSQEKRSPLPQPLFWSLFAHKITAIRKKKELESSLRELLEG